VRLAFETNSLNPLEGFSKAHSLAPFRRAPRTQLNIAALDWSSTSYGSGAAMEELLAFCSSCILRSESLRPGFCCGRDCVSLNRLDRRVEASAVLDDYLTQSRREEAYLLPSRTTCGELCVSLPYDTARLSLLADAELLGRCSLASYPQRCPYNGPHWR
jgi:hypothetical protein